jgi:GNAT superfamily N-acetyltransferase
MEFVDVSKRMGEPQIQEIFALAVGYPTPEKLDTLAQQYAGDPTWSALGLFDAAVPVGVLGFEMRSPGSAQIRYISVAPIRQRSGVGRRLIEEVRSRESLVELFAETHIDAVPFYLRCGFEVRSLGELWPGVERFACSWRAA